MVDGITKVSYTLHFCTLQVMVHIIVPCESAIECSMTLFDPATITKVAYHMEESDPAAVWQSSLSS
jgi:hypothetical protein